MLQAAGILNKLKENIAGDGNEKSRQAIAEKERVVWTGFSGQQVDEAAKEIGYDFSGVDKPKNENDGSNGSWGELLLYFLNMPVQVHLILCFPLYHGAG